MRWTVKAGSWFLPLHLEGVRIQHMVLRLTLSDRAHRVVEQKETNTDEDQISWVDDSAGDTKLTLHSKGARYEETGGKEAGGLTALGVPIPVARLRPRAVRLRAPLM